MSEIYNKVKIVSNGNWYGTCLYINGTEVQKCNAFCLSQAAGEIPKLLLVVDVDELEIELENVKVEKIGDNNGIIAETD